MASAADKKYSESFSHYVVFVNHTKINLSAWAIALCSVVLGVTIDLWASNRLILTSVLDLEYFSYYLTYCLPSMCLMIVAILRYLQASMRLHFYVLCIIAISLASLHAISLTQSLTVSPVSLLLMTILAKQVILPPVSAAIIVFVYLGFGMLFTHWFQYSVQLGSYYYMCIVIIFLWLMYLGMDGYRACKKEFITDKKLWKQNQKIAFQHMEILSSTARLKEVALKDQLTNLYNRHYFKKQLRTEKSRLRRVDMNLSLLMIDIDHFKQINDNLGHQTGDEYIKSVANTLLALCNRASDVIARYGGEEFIVLLPYTDNKGLLMLANKILKATRALQLPHPTASYLSISIGGVTVNNAQHDLIEIADRNLYYVKKNGRNNICLTEV